MIIRVNFNSILLQIGSNWVQLKFQMLAIGKTKTTALSYSYIPFKTIRPISRWQYGIESDVGVKEASSIVGEKPINEHNGFLDSHSFCCTYEYMNRAKQLGLFSQRNEITEYNEFVSGCLSLLYIDICNWNKRDFSFNYRWKFLRKWLDWILFDCRVGVCGKMKMYVFIGCLLVRDEIEEETWKT